jgi:hypothetical protein
MRRWFILGAATVGAVVAAVLPAPATQGQRYSLLTGSTSTNQLTVSVYGVSSFDPTGTNPPSDSGCVSISTIAGSDSGCGPLHAEIVPGTLAGRLTGTVPGGNGPITVDLAFAGSQASTYVPPASAYVVPSDPPYVFANVSNYRQGFLTGTIGAFFGSTLITAMNGNAYEDLTLEL